PGSRSCPERTERAAAQTRLEAMTVASLSVSSDSPTALAADVLIVGVLKTDDGPQIASDAPELQALQPTLAAIGITGATDEFRRLPLPGIAASSIALIGLGSGTPS